MAALYISWASSPAGGLITIEILSMNILLTETVLFGSGVLGGVWGLLEAFFLATILTIMPECGPAGTGGTVSNRLSDALRHALFTPDTPER
jgi:hypothetical protein